MEKLKSRQNSVIRFFRSLAMDSMLRTDEKLFVCDGEKILNEALRSGADVHCVLWKETRMECFPAFPEEYLLPEELFDYVSPMKNSPGPMFTVSMPEQHDLEKARKVILLEEIQDPGNAGTVIRAADAFGIDCVVMLDGCADPFAPKTVRASMGAIFRQNVRRMTRSDAVSFCRRLGLPLYGAALSRRAEDVRRINLSRSAVAIGSEGRGLSDDMLSICDGKIVIPMSGAAESLNAAVAASLIMWEMVRGED